MKNYQVVNGTSYNEKTSPEVIRVLESVKASGTRIKLDYGYTDVDGTSSAIGQSWGECYDVTGTIGRSTGSVKIPLLIHNRRSVGGGGILDHRIVQVKESKGGRVLYQHPNYKPYNQ